MMKDIVVCSKEDKKNIYELIYCEYCEGLYPILEVTIEGIEFTFCMECDVPINYDKQKIFLIKEEDLKMVGISKEYIQEKKIKVAALLRAGYIEYLVNKDALVTEETELVL